MSAPNVLLICSDQHHPRYGGCLGESTVQTPNLDRLADRGCVFTDAHCTDPVCGPSRRSFLTGRYVHEIAAWANCTPFHGHDETWAADLRDAGYETCLIGKMDLAGERQDGGFGEHQVRHRRPAWDPWPRTSPWGQRLDQPVRPDKRHLLDEAGAFGDGRATDLSCDLTGTRDRGHYDHDRWCIDSARQWLTRTHRRPWCLTVGLLYPHWPYRAPTEWCERYHDADLPGAAAERFPNPDLHPALRRMQRNLRLDEIEAPKMERVRRVYAAMISCMDAMIGELLDELERQGELQNTIVIYTSDHGEALGEHGLVFKHSPYRASLNVPLIVAGPGIPAGRRIERPVSLVDLHPTIRARFGLPVDPTRPGADLWPMITGTDVTRGPVFAEHHANFITGGWFAIVDENWKYVHYPDERASLFDRRKDPDECRDLGADPAYASVREACRHQLLQVCDPQVVSAKAARDLGLSARNPGVPI